MIKAVLVLLCVLWFCSCASKPAANLAEVEANAAKTAQPPPSSSPELLTSEAVLNALKTANLPIINVEVYTEETDKNHLLGRPHQYVGKINFGDARAKGNKFDKSPNSIEVFQNVEDLEARKNYTETISKSGSMFVQYIYAHKNVLLRLHHELLPKDAVEYERILNSL